MQAPFDDRWLFKGRSGQVIRQKVPPEVADTVPWEEGITSYDEAHLVTYLRLLDASGEGASEDEMARIVLGIDPEREPLRAREAVRSHLRRAQWMTEAGYRHFLEH